MGRPLTPCSGGNGDHLLTATDEIYSKQTAADNQYVLASASGFPISQGALDERTTRRPPWLRAEIIAFLVGASDFCLILGAAAVAFAAYSGLMERTLEGPERHILTTFLAAMLFISMFERLGGYRLQYLLRLDWQCSRVVMTCGFVASMLLLVAFFSKTSEIYSRGWMLAWMTTAPLLQIASRIFLKCAAARPTASGYFTRNVAIVGAGEEGHRLISRIRNGQDKSIDILGVFDDRKSRLSPFDCGLPVRGTSDDLLNFVQNAPVDEVIISLPLNAEHRVRSLCDKMKAVAIDVRVSLEPLAETLSVISTGYIGDVPLLEITDRPLKNWRAFFKFLEDRLLGLLLLVLIGPLMAIIALWIKLDSPGPVFFVQKRFGFNNQVIRVLKFR